MATVNHTFLSASGEAFVDTNEGNMTVFYNTTFLTWDNLGSLFQLLETARQTAGTNTWEDLGVPPSATVTGCRLLSARASTKNYTGVTNVFVTFYVRSTLGDTNLDVFDISVGTDPQTIDNSGGAVQTVTNHPAATDVRFDVNVEIFTDETEQTRGVDIDLAQIEITYSIISSGNYFLSSN